MGVNSIHLVGNFLNLKKSVRWTDWFIALAVAILVPLAEYVIDFSVIGIQINFSSIFYTAIVLWIIYVFRNIKMLYFFFRKCFSLRNSKLGIMVLFNIIVVIVSVVIFRDFSEFYFGVLFLMIFWFFSGILQSMLVHTDALYSQEIKEYLEISKIYSSLRLSAYFVLIIGLQIYIINYFDWGSLFSMIIPLISIPIFLLNLTPYYYKDNSLKNTVLMLRFIKNNKAVKKNVIINHFEIDEAFVDDQLIRLIQINILQENKKRFSIRK